MSVTIEESVPAAGCAHLPNLFQLGPRTRSAHGVARPAREIQSDLAVKRIVPTSSTTYTQLKAEVVSLDLIRDSCSRSAPANTTSWIHASGARRLGSGSFMNLPHRSPRPCFSSEFMGHLCARSDWSGDESGPRGVRSGHQNGRWWYRCGGRSFSLKRRPTRGRSEPRPTGGDRSTHG